MPPGYVGEAGAPPRLPPPGYPGMQMGARGPEMPHWHDEQMIRPPQAIRPGMLSYFKTNIFYK